MYDKPAFADTTTVTTHNIHSRGDGFHNSHRDVYKLVQNEVRRTKLMTDLHAQLHKIYAGNLDYHTSAFSEGLHTFFQLMPTYSDSNITGDKIMNTDKKVYMRMNDHYNCLDGTAACTNTHKAEECNEAYVSKEDTTTNPCPNKHRELDGGSAITSAMASMAEYYGKTKIGLAQKGVQAYPAIEGYLQEGDFVGGAFTVKNGDPTWFTAGTVANPNDLFYYTKVEMTSDENKSVAQAGLSTTAEPGFPNGTSPTGTDVNTNNIFQNYSQAGANCDNDDPTSITLDKAGEQVGCLENQNVGGLISRFPDTVSKGNYYHWDFTHATANKIYIKNKKLTKNGQYLSTTDGNAFEKVKGEVILKHASIKGKTEVNFTADGLTVPVDDAEFIQIYKTNSGDDKAFVVPKSSLTAASFMKNNFAFGTDGTMSTIELYARLKMVDSTSTSGNEACASVSNANTIHNVISYNTSHGKTLNSAKQYANQVSGQGAVTPSKLCEFAKQMNIPGRYMLAIARILRYQMKFTARELYLLNLYQYGTVVKIDSKTTTTPTEAIVVSPIDETKCENVIGFSDTKKYGPKNGASATDCPAERYIVLPLKHVNDATGVVKKKEFGYVDGEVANGADVPTNIPSSSFVLVEYTETNLDNSDLKKIYSGRPLITLSHKKYKNIQDELLNNYRLVGHDIDELNKIAALQEDTRVLGNKNYYMVMIYTVILFFLLGTIYMISK